MASSPLVEIVMAAAQLKAAAPQFYSQLTEALRIYEVQSILELGSADGNDVYRAQGKMKTIQQLRKHFLECTEMRDTYTRRDQNARSSSS